MNALSMTASRLVGLSEELATRLAVPEQPQLIALGIMCPSWDSTNTWDAGEKYAHRVGQTNP